MVLVFCPGVAVRTTTAKSIVALHTTGSWPARKFRPEWPSKIGRAFIFTARSFIVLSRLSLVRKPIACGLRTGLCRKRHCRWTILRSSHLAMKGNSAGESSKIVNRGVQRHVFPEGNSADDIGTADDAHDLIFAHDREPLDLVSGHELGNLFHRRLFFDADDFLAHDSFNVFTPLGDDVGLRNDAYDLAVFTGYRRAANLIFDQSHRQVLHRHGRSDGNDISGHDIFGYHLRSS